MDLCYLVNFFFFNFFMRTRNERGREGGWGVSVFHKDSSLLSELLKSKVIN